MTFGLPMSRIQPFSPWKIAKDGLSESLAAVQTIQKARKQTVHAATAENLQAQIDLAEHIQVIASKGKQTDVGIKNIRSTRKREQARTHIDFVKEGNICG